MAADPDAVERIRQLVNLVPLRLRLERWEGRRDVCRYASILTLGMVIGKLFFGKATEADAGMFGVWSVVWAMATISYAGCTWMVWTLRRRVAAS